MNIEEYEEVKWSQAKPDWKGLIFSKSLVRLKYFFIRDLKSYGREDESQIPSVLSDKKDLNFSQSMVSLTFHFFLIIRHITTLLNSPSKLFLFSVNR